MLFHMKPNEESDQLESVLYSPIFLKLFLIDMLNIILFHDPQYVVNWKKRQLDGWSEV